MEAPAITVTCECGERRDVPYRERWQCEKCGRSWDTGNIPEEDYEAVRRIQRRYRAVPLVVAVITAVAVGVLMAYGRTEAIVLLPVITTLWFFFGRPLQQRWLHSQVAALPEWKLNAD
jgi:hypothetical protein